MKRKVRGISNKYSTAPIRHFFFQSLKGITFYLLTGNFRNEEVVWHLPNFKVGNILY